MDKIIHHSKYKYKKDNGICTFGGCSLPICKETKIYCTKHREYNRQALQSRMLAIKLEVLNAYGGPKCVHCGETELWVLCIDHIAGGGKKEFKSLNVKGGWTFYRKLKKLGFPKGVYQVLCANCNLYKQIHGDLCQ